MRSHLPEELYMFDLTRFKKAQKQALSGFEAALAEIRAGHKRSHWIWYIFPQLIGLGSSGPARVYGIDGLGEATAYLRDPELRARLLLIATAVAEHLRKETPLPLTTLMGSTIDVLKLVSSLTLFEDAARRLHASEGLPEYEALERVAKEILAAAATQGYPACRYTRAQLGAPPQE
jgi:uncharacterized protein (DUF1810 family)